MDTRSYLNTLRRCLFALVLFFYCCEMIGQETPKCVSIIDDAYEAVKNGEGDSKTAEDLLAEIKEEECCKDANVVCGLIRAERYLSLGRIETAIEHYLDSYKRYKNLENEKIGKKRYEERNGISIKTYIDFIDRCNAVENGMKGQEQEQEEQVQEEQVQEEQVQEEQVQEEQVQEEQVQEEQVQEEQVQVMSYKERVDSVLSISDKSLQKFNKHMSGAFANNSKMLFRFKVELCGVKDLKISMINIDSSFVVWGFRDGAFVNEDLTLALQYFVYAFNDWAQKIHVFDEIRTDSLSIMIEGAADKKKCNSCKYAPVIEGYIKGTYLEQIDQEPFYETKGLKRVKYVNLEKGDAIDNLTLAFLRGLNAKTHLYRGLIKQGIKIKKEKIYVVAQELEDEGDEYKRVTITLVAHDAIQFFHRLTNEQKKKEYEAQIDCY